MLTLLTSSQTREADSFTIKNQPVSSIDLMEKASQEFVKAFMEDFAFRDVRVSVYCGTGNNGGDGLAIARLLKEKGYDNLKVKIARFSPSSTAGFDVNLLRLGLTGIPITVFMDSNSFPVEEADILIEALLGSGLNKPIEGEYRKLVEHLNALGKKIVSVDVPAGFPSKGLIDPQSTIIKADLVISFQRPKINFFFPESAPFISRFRFVDIGLDENFIQEQPGGWKLTEEDDIRQILKPREPFSHKGTFGHALIIAGSAETMGAALLCADACVHSGAGLTTACIPPEGLTALNSRSPEAMTLIRDAGKELRIDFEKYLAIAIGPGLGMGEEQASLLKTVLAHTLSPLVLDADALNILAENPHWMSMLPQKTILTPHVREFDRLFGKHDNWWERLKTGRKKAAQYQLIIVLKNQYSFVILPDGDVLINPTGNPAMAVGGMGDVLTGVIAAFLAQGYKPEEVAIAACYIHGETGDLLNKRGMHCIPPRYLIDELPKTISSFTE